MSSLRLPTFAETLAVSRSHGRLSAHPNLWDELAFHLPGTQGGGKHWKDVSGFDNHGTLTNMDPATAWVMTEKGWALDFDGSNDYVEFPSGLLGVAGSISLWVKLGGNQAAKGTLLQETASGYVDWDFDTANTSCEVSIYDTGFTDFVVDLGTTWKHMVLTWSTTNTSLYIDGARTNSDDTFTGLNGNADTICLGQDRNHYDASLLGRIANLCIYSCALSPNEIQQLYVDPHAIVRPMQRIPVGTTGGAPAGLSIPIAMHHYRQLQGA